MSEVEPDWLETDISSHFPDSCHFFEREFNAALGNERNWLWAFVSAVSVIQAACLLFLGERSTNSLNTWDSKSSKAWLENRRLGLEDQVKVNRRLANTRELLRRVRRHNELETFDTVLPFLKNAIELRNTVMHFAPGSWFLDLNLVPDVMKGTARFAIEILDTPGENASTYLNAANRRAAKQELTGILERAEKL